MTDVPAYLILFLLTPFVIHLLAVLADFFFLHHDMGVPVSTLSVTIILLDRMIDRSKWALHRAWDLYGIMTFVVLVLIVTYQKAIDHPAVGLTDLQIALITILVGWLATTTLVLRYFQIPETEQKLGSMGEWVDDRVPFDMKRIKRFRNRSLSVGFICAVSLVLFIMLEETLTVTDLARELELFLLTYWFVFGGYSFLTLYWWKEDVRLPPA